MSDFDEWRSNFLISINSDGNFKSSFDECIKYVEQIALFNQICTYSDKTDSFLVDTLKPAIDTILKYQITSANRIKLGDITYFLKTITVLLEWAFVNNRFNLFDICNQITNPEMELYESIKKEYSGKCENLIQIKKYIVEHEYMTIMLMKIQKATDLQVDHFLFFFQTFNKLNEFMNENAKISMLYGLFEPYQNFLDCLIHTDSKKINTNKLQELFTNFFILASTADLDVFRNCIERMTLLASNLFFSTDYNYQKVGSTLFKIFAETKTQQKQEFINQTFIKSLSEHKLISKILSTKLSSDNYSIVTPLIDQISTSDSITGNDLKSMWESAIKTTKTESESIINTLINILKQIKYPEVENFFKLILVFPEKTSKLNDDQKDKYSEILEILNNFVVELLLKRDRMQSETAQLAFNKLFDSAEQYIHLTGNQPNDFLNLQKIYIANKDNKKNNNSSNLNQMRKMLINVLHTRFNKEYKSFIVYLLTDIANSSNCIKEDFEEKDIKTISKYIIDLSYDEKNINEDDIQYSLYPLYTILINSFNQKINSIVIDAMLKSPSDALWDFLFQIIEKSRLKNFEEDAIQSLTNFILKNYMQKSTLFLDFLKLFILNMNERVGSIELPYNSSEWNEFTINKTPLLYEEDVLEKIIIETDDDSILKHIIDICFDIYKEYPDQEEVITKLLSLFNKFVDDKNNQNLRTKINIITLLFEYCKKKDKSKTVALISHNKLFNKCLSDKSNGKYTVIYALPDNEKAQIKFDVSPSTHSLYMKISPYLNSSIYNYCLCRKDGTSLSLNDKLDFSTFKRSRNVIVKEVKDGKFVETKQEENKDKKEEESKDKKEEENKDKKEEGEGENKDKDKNEEGDAPSKNDNFEEEEINDSSIVIVRGGGVKPIRSNSKKKTEIKGGGFFKNYQQIPSEIFVQNNVNKTLFNIFNHFDNPSLGNDENQSKLDELVYKFLSYLPTDPELLVLFGSHENCIPESLKNFDFQSFMNNKYILQYILQVLILKLNCKKFIEPYKNPVQQLLSRIINVDDSSFTIVTFLMKETLKLIELMKLNSNDFILLLIKMLSLSSISDNSDECKLKIVEILNLLINEIDISNLLCDQIDVFNSVLTSISNKVWTNFKEMILFKMKNPEKLFGIILNNLLQCNEEDMMNQINRYYTDIFSHFIISISNKTEDSNDINNIVKIFMKMLRINPTTIIIDSFDKIATKNIELLKSQTNECSLESIVDCLINIIRLDNKPLMMNKIVELLLHLASLDEKSQKQLNDFAEQIASYKVKEWNQMSIADQQNSNTDDDNNNGNDDDNENDGILSISNKEKGLRNINQTCYMNSALQQFYHIPAFRYFISNPKQNNANNDNDKDKDKDEIPITPSLCSLFTNMEFSKKTEINPEEFFMIFSSKHSDFEIGKQQDCQEFVDYFIDDIKGKAHDLFEWKILTKYQKLDDLTDISSAEETSVSIPLSVKSGSMKQSVKDYFSPQKLTGDNLYQTSNGAKMESIVTQKIITAPPVLIFQLKRFDYDKGSQNRVKINKRFELMNKISMKQYMLNKDTDNDPYNYILNGVVVHSGNGMHGHYTSLIKEDIQSDNWLRYDDSSVSRIKNRSEFERLAFGENKENEDDSYGTNGYLLFYVRENATVEVLVKDEKGGKIHEESKFILDNSFPSHISEQLESNIEADNNYFLFNQCALEKSTFMFMVNSGSNVQMLKYFFGIFVHTKMFDKIKEIEDNLTKVSDTSSYLQFLDDDSNFNNYVLPVFSGASPDKMETSAFNVINKIVTISKDKEIAANLVQRFILNLKSIHKKWNRVCNIGSFVLNFINKQDKECLFAIKNGWEKMLLDYIFAVYEEKNGNFKNINIETIFNSLGKIITSSSTRDSSCLNLYLKLPSINEKVKESNDDSNKKSYKDLIIDCVSSQIFSVADVDETLGSDFPRLSFILKHQIERAEADTLPSLFESLMSVQGFTVDEIISCISDTRKLINSLLAPNLQLIANLLLFKEPFRAPRDLKAAKNVAELITKVSYYQEPKLRLGNNDENVLFDMLKNEIPKLDKAYQPFFTVLNFLIQKLNIPPSEKIEGLEELVAKSRDNVEVNDANNDIDNDNTDMINIEIHFHPDKLTERCSELLKQANSPNPSDLTFDSIISLIDACESQPVIFAQIVSLPEWKSVIRKHSSSRNYSFLDKLASTLSKIQGKTLSNVKKDKEGSEILRFSLINAICYLNSLIDSGDRRYYKYVPNLEPFIEESFKNSKSIINQNKGSKIENESDVHFLYIEPDFQTILDFNSYITIIENIIKDSKRNAEKDTAIGVYSNFIIKLIDIGDKFAKSISDDDDSDKLKSIKQYIEKSLSTLKLNPDDIMSSKIESENDGFIINLINLSYSIAKYNNEFFEEINNYIKRNIGNSPVSPLFKLKFGIKEIIDMPIDKRSKEILQLSKRVKRHREVFFGLLLDIMLENNNHEFIKAVTSSLIIEETQMSEKSFNAAQVSRDTSNSIQEKNFFELMISQFTDDEFDDILHQINEKYKNAFEANSMFDLMQITTKFLVLICAKHSKKNDIIKLIPNKGRNIDGRPGSVVKLILDFKP